MIYNSKYFLYIYFEKLPIMEKNHQFYWQSKIALEYNATKYAESGRRVDEENQGGVGKDRRRDGSICSKALCAQGERKI